MTVRWQLRCGRAKAVIHARVAAKWFYTPSGGELQSVLLKADEAGLEFGAHCRQRLPQKVTAASS